MSIFIYYMSIYIYVFWISLTLCKTSANTWVYRYTCKWTYTSMTHICLYTFIICLYTFISFESNLLCAKLLRIYEYINTYISWYILVLCTYVCIDLWHFDLLLFLLNKPDSCVNMNIHIHIYVNIFCYYSHRSVYIQLYFPYFVRRSCVYMSI